jgi:hypothetical protein
MRLTGSIGQVRRLPGTEVPAQLLAQAAVAVGSTLGTGSDEDNRELDALERAVWLELRLCCPDRREREWRIEQARGTVAAPGAPSCWHAVSLLTRTAGWLAHAAGRVTPDEHERMARCGDQCIEGAARLGRIAVELKEVRAWR